MKEWHTILSKCSFKWMQTLVRKYQCEQERLNLEIAQIDLTLGLSKEHKEYKKCDNRLKMDIETMEKEIMDMKHKIFLRDKADYEQDERERTETKTLRRGSRGRGNRWKKRNGDQERKREKYHKEKIEVHMDKDLVINLSTYPLTNYQRFLLNSGLNFCRSTHFSLFDTVTDLNRLIRLLALKIFFHTTQDSQSEMVRMREGEQDFLTQDVFEAIERLDPDVYRQLHTPHPEDNTDRIVHRDLKARSHLNFIGHSADSNNKRKYDKNDEKDKKDKKGKIDKNVNKEHNYKKMQKMEMGGRRKAIRSLGNNMDIVVRSSDKGGSIVVLDREYYEQDILEQLQDQDNYKLLVGDPTESFKSNLKGILHYCKKMNILNPYEIEYIWNEYLKVPIIHTIPKVHKDPVCPKGRPIVAGIGSLNEGLN
ncbi:hypothetical protein XELAEV_18003598mg [Xenopus laevis]|nr:hypothetical protein XELAEV_18003598mg [Xenopus laevis]